jgi:hypothetical protein
VVIDSHPILSAIPVDEDSAHPYFARLSSINLEEAVTFFARKQPSIDNGTDVELDALLQAQHNLPFKARYGEAPFWRLMILTDPAVENGTEFVACFIFHHALGDGGSGMIFHKHFLSALASTPPPLSNTTILSSNTPLLPNLEAALPLTVSPPNPAPTLPGLWCGSQITAPMTTNFRSLRIPTITTSQFIQACRANGTTITATVPVLLACALSSLLPPQYQSFEALIPVNLRRWLPGSLKDTEGMGVFIDAFSQYYMRTNLSSFTWDEARRSKATINSYLKTGGQEVNVARLQSVGDMRGFFLGKLGKERGSSFDVSNIGGLAGGEGGEWRMGKMVFSRSAFVSGSAFSTGVVTGPDGCLVFGFVWQEGVVERELMEGVIEKVRCEIERLAREK